MENEKGKAGAAFCLRRYYGRVKMMQGADDMLQEIINKTKRLVFFGGAGVSTASGIPDFRSAKGLYSERIGDLTPEMILSSSFFYLHPAPGV